MPRKSTTKRSKTAKKRSQRGKGVMDVLRYVKDNKLISRGLGLIPHPGAQALSSIAGLVGLGRRKRKSTTRKCTTRKCKVTSMRGRAMKGRGIFGDLGSGIGSVFGGLGSGVGSIAHGLFGGGRKGSISRRPHRSVILI